MPACNPQWCPTPPLPAVVRLEDGRLALPLSGMLALYAAGLTPDHAVLLMHLMECASEFRGMWVTHRTADHLAEEFKEFAPNARGWERKSVEVRVRQLVDAGLVKKLKGGQYEICTQPGVAIVADKRGTPPNQYPETHHGTVKDTRLLASTYVSTSDVSNEHEHVHEDHANNSEFGKAAWAAAAKAGLRGRLLDEVALNPLRGLCWLTHAETSRFSGKTRDVGALVNSMMIRPGDSREQPWPPGTGGGTLVRLGFIDGDVCVMTSDGSRWEPAGTAPKSVRGFYATVDVVSRGCAGELDGHAWDHDPEFLREAGDYSAEAVAIGYAARYSSYVGSFRALQARGLLIDYELPANWQSMTGP